MTEAKTSTTAALPWASPPPSAPKIPAAGSQSGINPESIYHAHTHTLPSPFHLHAPESEDAPNVTKVLSLLTIVSASLRSAKENNTTHKRTFA